MARDPVPSDAVSPALQRLLRRLEGRDLEGKLAAVEPLGVPLADSAAERRRTVTPRVTTPRNSAARPTLTVQRLARARRRSAAPVREPRRSIPIPLPALRSATERGGWGSAPGPPDERHYPVR
jgi:hypothetical protein